MQKKIRCIAVDDEPLALDILEEYIQDTSCLELVGVFTNPIEAIQRINEGGIDLVFLDIQMPEITGIDFIRIVKGKALVILTTANSQYAFEGFELDVVDYLLKPISPDRFQRAIQKMELLFDKDSIAQMNGESAFSETENEDFIFVKSDNKIVRVDFNSIRYIEGLKDYISIFTVKERIVTLMGMKKIEEMLPSKKFLRVHRSYIVPLDKIDKVDKSRIYIGEMVIPVGETFRGKFFQTIVEDRK